MAAGCLKPDEWALRGVDGCCFEISQTRREKRNE
jgi:hypothetical protein